MAHCGSEEVLIVGGVGCKYTVVLLALSVCVGVDGKLQALVYNILPSTTAVFSYAIGPRKLSANEQFFVCLLYTSPSPRDRHRSRMPSSA